MIHPDAQTGSEAPQQYPNFEGLGRPVADGWLNHFEQVMREEAGDPSVEFEFRAPPGIVYVEGPSLTTAYIDERIPEDVTTTDAVVENLIARAPQGLHSARHSIDLTVVAFEVKPIREDPEVQLMCLRVGDFVSRYSVHVVRTEKATANREVGPADKDFPALRNPKKSRHYIPLGTMVDPAGAFDVDRCSGLRRVFGPKVPLGPMGRMGYHSSAE